MKRVFRPLDIDGLRLYRVFINFSQYPSWDYDNVVAAKSPTQAKELIKKLYAGTEWIEELYLSARALNVYQPKEWYENEIRVMKETNGQAAREMGDWVQSGGTGVPER